MGYLGPTKVKLIFFTKLTEVFVSYLIKNNNFQITKKGIQFSPSPCGLKK
jgi:hypothetical protein